MDTQHTNDQTFDPSRPVPAALAAAAPGQVRDADRADRAAAATAWLCATCGVQYDPSLAPPAHCPVCEDERQYVGFAGQQWTRLGDLQQRFTNEFAALEPGLTSIQTRPGFAIGQRAFLIETPEGNVLWDCLSVIDDASIAWIEERGGIAAIAISHPHFFGAMIEWSHAFGRAPIWIHERDRRWVQRSDGALRTWSGTSLPLLADLSLVHVGGHFEGSQVLHWPRGAGGRGALFTGDLPNVCSDRRWVTFMRSYPNFIPLAAHEIERVAAALRPYAFDRIYGWSPQRTLETDAKRAVERSAERQIRAMRGGQDG
ncbi:MAG: MBL fold metallo-hydrolase [Myxococcota bacterium]